MKLRRTDRQKDEKLPKILDLGDAIPRPHPLD